MNKAAVYAQSVRRIIGDDLTEDLRVDQVYRELAQRWHVLRAAQSDQLLRRSGDREPLATAGR